MPTPNLYPIFTKAQSGGGEIVVPGILEAAIEETLTAEMSDSVLDAQVQQGLAISVADSIMIATIQSSLSVSISTIQVEVDIC